MYISRKIKEAMTKEDKHGGISYFMGCTLIDHTVNNVRISDDSVRNIYIEDGQYVINDLMKDKKFYINPTTLRGVNVGELSEISSLLSLQDVVSELMILYSGNKIDKITLNKYLVSLNGFITPSIAGNYSCSVLKVKYDDTPNTYKFSFIFSGRRSLIRPLLIPYIYLNEKTNNIHLALVYTTISDMINHTRKLNNGEISESIRHTLQPLYNMKSSMIPAYESIQSIFEMTSKGNWRVPEGLYHVTMNSIKEVGNIISDKSLSKIDNDIPHKDIYYGDWLHDAFINGKSDKSMNHIMLMNIPINGRNEEDYIEKVIKLALTYYETYRSIDELIQVTDCIYDTILQKPSEYIKTLDSDMFRVLTSDITTKDSDVRVRTYQMRKRDNKNTSGVSLILNNLMSIMVAVKLYEIKILATKGIEEMPDELSYIGTFNMIRNSNIFDIKAFIMANIDDNTINIHMVDFKTGSTFTYNRIVNTKISKELDSCIYDTLNAREFDMYSDERFEEETPQIRSTNLRDFVVNVEQLQTD